MIEVEDWGDQAAPSRGMPAGQADRADQECVAEHGAGARSGRVRTSRLGLIWANGVWLGRRPQVKRASDHRAAGECGVSAVSLGGAGSSCNGKQSVTDACLVARLGG